MALLRVPLVVWCVMRWRHLCHSSLVVSRVKVVLRGLCHSPQVVVMPGNGDGVVVGLRHSPPSSTFVAVVDDEVVVDVGHGGGGCGEQGSVAQLLVMCCQV